MKLELVKNNDEFNEWIDIAKYSNFNENESEEKIIISSEFREEAILSLDYTKSLEPNFKIIAGYSILLALKNKEGQIVGTASIRKDTHKSGSAQINNVAVNPKYRRNGYGKLMIEEICKLVKAHSNFNLITLTTGSTQNFYLKIGMNLAGVLDFDGKKRYFLYKKISN